MGNKIYFEIPGEPVAKARPRVTKQGITYTPKKTENYENLVKLCYMQQNQGDKLEGQLKANIKAFFQILL